MDEKTENNTDEVFDIEELESKSAEEVIQEREQALAEQLKEMRARKRKLVDPIQFEMSIEDVDLASYVPNFGWEMAPVSDKQKKALEKFGIFSDEIGNAGKAQMLIDRLIKRKEAGLATAKQIRFLEKKGFLHVGKWTFESASKMISRISMNNWVVPNGIDPKTYMHGVVNEQQ